MKKNICIFLISLFTSFIFAKGTVIRVTPVDFKDCITVYNETDKDIVVYLNILYAGSQKKYRSETVQIKSYSHKDMDFDYDSEWHDLVKDVKKFFNTKDKSATAYEFEFHFSEENIVLDEVRTKAYITENSFEKNATHNSYEIFVRMKDDEGF